MNSLFKLLCEHAIVEGSTLANDVKIVLDAFFSQNVCIPKGANRHPYADVWHKYLEDTSIKLESQRNDGTWLNTSISELHEIRIKPLEPVYEWQWTTISCGIKLYTEHLTDDILSLPHNCDYLVKDEETKRVRQ